MNLTSSLLSSSCYFLRKYVFPPILLVVGLVEFIISAFIILLFSPKICPSPNFLASKIGWISELMFHFSYNRSMLLHFEIICMEYVVESMYYCSVWALVRCTSMDGDDFILIRNVGSLRFSFVVRRWWIVSLIVASPANWRFLSSWISTIVSKTIVWIIWITFLIRIQVFLLVHVVQKSVIY